MARTLEQRRQRLLRSQLYFVTEGRANAATRALLDSAIAGGADLIQLRDKDLPEAEIPAASHPFAAAAKAGDALFILNDRPDLVGVCRADGVHVGQDDVGVAESRKLAGPDALVGLSTHHPEQLDAACSATGPERPDYVSVGPIWATPTKPGRPATGLDYVAYAAQQANLPWFAIGGVDKGNIAEVLAAGAERVVVVRAIRDVSDPRTAASELREAFDPTPDHPTSETSRNDE